MDNNLASSPRGLDENLSRDVEFLVQITNRSRWPETSITGVLERDENDITKSKIRASIDAATISTREAQRDAHPKSPDFFHVEKHSALTFNSTVISRTQMGN